MTTLGSLVDPVSKAGPNPDDEVFTYIDLSSVDAQLKVIAAPTEVAVSDAPSRARQQVRPGDVLVSTVRPNLNGVAMVPENLEGAIASTGFSVLRPKADILDARYLFHFVRSASFVRALVERATGASYPAVSNAIVGEVEIPLPPLPEQRRIASILDGAESLRIERRSALHQLDQLPTAIFDSLFGAGAPNAPTQELGAVVAEGTSVTYGIVQAGPETPGGVPYIRTGDLVDGEIRVQGLRLTSPQIAKRFPRSAVRAGDIVMSIRATVGTTALVPEELDGANLTQGTARISPGPNVDAVYLLGFLRSRQAQAWIAAQVKGATFREITLGRLRELPVPVPPRDLQQHFIREFELIQSAKSAHQRHLAKLDELFAGLQYRAFRGDL